MGVRDAALPCLVLGNEWPRLRPLLPSKKKDSNPVGQTPPARGTKYLKEK